MQKSNLKEKISETIFVVISSLFVFLGVFVIGWIFDISKVDTVNMYGFFTCIVVSSFLVGYLIKHIREKRHLTFEEFSKVFTTTPLANMTAREMYILRINLLLANSEQNIQEIRESLISLTEIDFIHETAKALIDNEVFKGEVFEAHCSSGTNGGMVTYQWITKNYFNAPLKSSLAEKVLEFSLKTDKEIVSYIYHEQNAIYNRYNPFAELKRKLKPQDLRLSYQI